jgi:glutathione S-transferase
LNLLEGVFRFDPFSHIQVVKMTLKVYGVAMSTCTGRVLATIFEKDVTDYELVPVNIMAGEQKKPEFLALQPFGKIPVVQDGGLTLFESRAIARFIAHKFEKQGTALYGSTQKDKVLTEQWLEVEGQNYNPAISAVVAELVFKPLRGLTADEAEVAANLEKLEKVLDVYEAHLAKSKYLAGDFFSLADLSHIPYTHYFINFAKKGEVFDKRPHVKAWWTEISSRPSWKKVQELIAASKPPQ